MLGARKRNTCHACHARAETSAFPDWFRVELSSFCSVLSSTNSIPALIDENCPDSYKRHWHWRAIQWSVKLSWSCAANDNSCVGRWVSQGWTLFRQLKPPLALTLKGSLSGLSNFLEVVQQKNLQRTGQTQQFLRGQMSCACSCDIPGNEEWSSIWSKPHHTGMCQVHCLPVHTFLMKQVRSCSPLNESSILIIWFAWIRAKDLDRYCWWRLPSH